MGRIPANHRLLFVAGSVKGELSRRGCRVDLNDGRNGYHITADHAVAAEMADRALVSGTCERGFRT